MLVLTHSLPSPGTPGEGSGVRVFVWESCPEPSPPTPLPEYRERGGRREEIVVPECGVVFTVLEVRGDQVRLGISAPADVGVHRREVWERIRARQVLERLTAAAEGLASPRDQGGANTAGPTG